MTAPTVESGHTTFQDGSSETSRTINAPSSAASNTVCIFTVVDGVQNITLGGGVTHETVLDDISIYSGDNTATLAMYLIEEDASPPSTYTIENDSSERGVGIAVAISDANGVDGTPPTPNGGDSGTATCPSATPSENDTLAFLIVGTDSETAPHGAVSGYTLLATVEQASAGTISVYYKQIATAAATGNNDVSLNSTNEWAAATVILLGDGGGGAGSPWYAYAQQ